MLITSIIFKIFTLKISWIVKLIRPIFVAKFELWCNVLTILRSKLFTAKRIHLLNFFTTLLVYNRWFHIKEINETFGKAFDQSYWLRQKKTSLPSPPLVSYMYIHTFFYFQFLFYRKDALIIALILYVHIYITSI